MMMSDLFFSFYFIMLNIKLRSLITLKKNWFIFLTGPYIKKSETMLCRIFYLYYLWSYKHIFCWQLWYWNLECNYWKNGISMICDFVGLPKSSYMHHYKKFLLIFSHWPTFYVDGPKIKFQSIFLTSTCDIRWLYTCPCIIKKL